MFRPRPLEVTAADELVAIENLDVLRQNGFELEFTENDATHHRLKLVAQPVSKNTVFDMTGQYMSSWNWYTQTRSILMTLFLSFFNARIDLEELLHLMHDRPVGQMVRCSKARSMFASRACRKSVMIGMPLTKGQMKTVSQERGADNVQENTIKLMMVMVEQVIQHMGTMEQPWNCPHGRPTMRHLSDLGKFVKEKSEKKKGVRWTDFLAGVDLI
jgi:DNA mismatch repair protein PMS2